MPRRTMIPISIASRYRYFSLPSTISKTATWTVLNNDTCLSARRRRWIPVFAIDGNIGNVTIVSFSCHFHPHRQFRLWVCTQGVEPPVHPEKRAGSILVLSHVEDFFGRKPTAILLQDLADASSRDWRIPEYQVVRSNNDSFCRTRKAFQKFL